MAFKRGERPRQSQLIRLEVSRRSPSGRPSRYQDPSTGDEFSRSMVEAVKYYGGLRWEQKERIEEITQERRREQVETTGFEPLVEPEQFFDIDDVIEQAGAYNWDIEDLASRWAEANDDARPVADILADPDVLGDLSILWEPDRLGSDNKEAFLDMLVELDFITEDERDDY